MTCDLLISLAAEKLKLGELSLVLARIFLISRKLQTWAHFQSWPPIGFLGLVAAQLPVS